jgi:hypothetical protein
VLRLVWMQGLGFVSGHDFSRAVRNEKRIGLQPLPGRLRPIQSAGAKALIFDGPFMARLKSCPDTKHQSRGVGKLLRFADLSG